MQICKISTINDVCNVYVLADKLDSFYLAVGLL